MLTSLQWDAHATATLDHLHRLIHGEPAPVSRIVQILGKSCVPGDGHGRPIAEYLTRRESFGAGYDAMRKAMGIVVECFRQERGDVVPPIPGDYGLTAQFRIAHHWGWAGERITAFSSRTAQQDEYDRFHAAVGREPGSVE